MAYNESLASRVGAFFSARGVAHEEKRMMGGLCMLVDDKMCVGIEKDRLMVRLDPEIYEEALTRDGCKPMDFTGRPMKGFVFVDVKSLASDSSLHYWLELALAYNPLAKKSKKKKN